MSRRQLMEVEAKLKSTLAELQERSLQHEKLKESHKCLQYGPAPKSLVLGKLGPSGWGVCVCVEVWLWSLLNHPPKWGGRGCRAAQNLPAPGAVGFAPSDRGGERCSVHSIPPPLQGQASRPPQGAGENQGRAPGLAAEEGKGLLVPGGHRRQQAEAAGACRLPASLPGKGGRSGVQGGKGGEENERAAGAAPRHRALSPRRTMTPR